MQFRYTGEETTANAPAIGGSTTRSMFGLFADGDRLVLQVSVSVDDPERIIYVAAAEDVHGASRQATKGRAELRSEVEIGVDGVTARIDKGSVANYIVPRAVTLMARVYVPQVPIF